MDRRNDDIWVLVGVTIAIGVVVAKWDQIWAAAGQWLIEHHLIVTTSVVLTLPGAEGAGLDLPRLALVGAIVLGLLAWAATRARSLVRHLRAPRAQA
ncbi:hypothetical protein [Cellulosimicrobium funkei]|uniref:Uncharacterized protein n=1 Tax=Cellulosimicrobium funkei TaxID=264251 RepID=A0A4Y8QXG7_9MICO|nr:hypothetical protein [Cellulosimicrobium funkei]TFF04393.1 hypothetical protein E1O70_18275 [Cellulosimicrobium funkei]TGA67942.1 hypothetical protein EQW79_018515 [Cellulosimicrobium terreum]